MRQANPVQADHEGPALNAAESAGPSRTNSWPDNRPVAAAQRKIAADIANSPQLRVHDARDAQAGASARMLMQRSQMTAIGTQPVQRQKDATSLQQASMPIQRMLEPEDDAPAPLVAPVVNAIPLAPPLNAVAAAPVDQVAAPALHDGIADAAAAMQARLDAPIAQRLAAVLDQQQAAMEEDIARMPVDTTDLRSYQNLLLDLTSDQIREAIENADGDPFILKGYLADTMDYTSCYPAAERLLSLLGVTGSPQEQNGGQGPVIRGAAQQDVLMTGLTNAMQARAAAHQPTIFHIGLAGHGFILVARLGRVEHLEAVAHSADLMASIEDAPEFTMADVVEYLHAMVDDDEDERERGADEMRWNAEPLGLLDRDEDTQEWLLKYYGLVWHSRPLAGMQEISQRVAARISANRVAVMTGLGL